MLVPPLCLTLCNPVDYCPPGSSVHSIFQARILEWVAILFCRASSQPRDQTRVSHTAGRFFIVWATSDRGGAGCEQRGTTQPPSGVHVYVLLLLDMLALTTPNPLLRLSSKPGYWLLLWLALSRENDWISKQLSELWGKIIRRWPWSTSSVLGAHNQISIPYTFWKMVLLAPKLRASTISGPTVT